MQDLCFRELTTNELESINGGTFFGFLGGVFDCIAGIAAGVGGVITALIPSLDGATQYAGVSAVIGGAVCFCKGVDEIISNL